MSETNTTPVSEVPADGPQKKQGLPLWVVVLVLAVCFGAVYEVYTKETADKPPTVIKPKKGEQLPPGPHAPKPGAKPGKRPPNVKPGTHPEAPAPSTGE